MSRLEVMEVDFAVAGGAILRPSHLLEEHADRASLLLRLLVLLLLTPMMSMAHDFSDLADAGLAITEVSSPKRPDVAP